MKQVFKDGEVEECGSVEAVVSRMMALGAMSIARDGHCQVICLAGPEWDAEDEEPVATLPGTGPTSLSTTFALITPGNSATYKVFTILTTGAERGSNPVTVTRPV